MSEQKVKMLTKEEILFVDDSQKEVVEVPEWGGSVIVKGLSGLERDAFEASVIQTRGKNTKMNTRNLRARLVQLSVVDENGKNLFDLVDIEALGKKSALAIQRIFDVASRLSGLTPEDAEELAKNSESDQSADFISD